MMQASNHFRIDVSAIKSLMDSISICLGLVADVKDPNAASGGCLLGSQSSLDSTKDLRDAHHSSCGYGGEKVQLR
jgi:hypothetical protein